MLYWNNIFCFLKLFIGHSLGSMEEYLEKSHKQSLNNRGLWMGKNLKKTI